MNKSNPKQTHKTLLIQLDLLTQEARRKANEYSTQDAKMSAYYHGVAFAYEDAAERVRDLYPDG